MFKKVSVLFITIMTVLVMSSGAKAAPTYYTFSGNVFAANDAAGAIANAGLSIGSAVSYTYKVDTAAIGMFTVPGYPILTQPAYNPLSDTFYWGELVSQSPIVNPGGYESFPKMVYNYAGVNSTDNLTYLMGGSFTNTTAIDNINTWNGTSYAGMASWVVGLQGFTALTTAMDSSGNESMLYVNLRLSGISNINPLTSAVPEPSTLLLLGSGLAGLGFMRRRFKK